MTLHVYDMMNCNFIMLIELSRFGLVRNHMRDLKSKVRFQTKITRYEVQLPLYYTHFEITKTFSILIIILFICLFIFILMG